MTHPDAESACAAAIKAGCDVECGGNYHKYIPLAIAKGLMTEEDLNVCFRREAAGDVEVFYCKACNHVPEETEGVADFNELATRVSDSDVIVVRGAKHTVTIPVTNTGSLDGDEVVQV